FHLADLFFHHGYRPALIDLVEVLLDQEATDVESWLQNVSEPSLELLTYVRVRTLNNKEDWKGALALADKGRDVLFESNKLAPAEAAQISPRQTLAYAEASLRNGEKTISYEHISAITNLESPWRYAFRTLVLYAAMRVKGAQFVSIMQSFLESFGNDLHIWYDTLASAPDDIHWGPTFTATLAREAFALPHEPAVWKSVALLMGDEDASTGYDEVRARIQSQASS
ncbi:MAG: hypothetical protein JWN44_6901, partial [Myxococcales bacterium]|nr:hypothetical protein [Myxococcales bacterium]